MDSQTRNLVRSRAQERCEYCRLRQVHFPLWRHQVEHIIAKKHGGNDDLQNLALACVRCNLSKASNLSGIDEVSEEIVTLFNPRNHQWQEHFQYNKHLIEGHTPSGRATVRVLNMNEPERLRLRAELLENGELD